MRWSVDEFVGTHIQPSRKPSLNADFTSFINSEFDFGLLLQEAPNYNLICAVTTQNITSLLEVVDFMHEMEVPIGMLNPVRCTRQGARDIKPSDVELWPHYKAALDWTHELYEQTGRKLVIANVFVSVVAPSARRLMCDISSCGGGRCFFAVGAKGDLFPCSEFVGVPEFNGGNLFEGNIAEILETAPFKAVTGRRVEDITPCSSCAIRHFCGSLCPAEAYEIHGAMNKPGAFCELYEDKVRYALRRIADGKENDFLWDGWDENVSTSVKITSLLIVRMRLARFPGSGFTTVDGTTVQSIKIVAGPEHGTLFLDGNSTTFVLTPGRLY